MFEASFINMLKNDSELSGMLSTFNSWPAIFSDVAPQEATEPYIVFSIMVVPTEALIVDRFSINIDIYDKDTSCNNIRNIVERIIFTTDLQIINNDPRYKGIRFYRDNEGYIENSNIDFKHYNLQIEARGARRKWADQL